MSGISEEGSCEVKVSSNEDLRHFFSSNRSETFIKLGEKLREWRDMPYLYLFVYTLPQAERMREILRTYGVSLPILERPSLLQREREWGIVVGPLKRGFRTERAIFLTEDDVFGPKKRVARLKGRDVDYFLESFRDLKIGDYVVHVDHGIGLYRGIVELSVDGSRKDFLLIEFDGGDKLYVPIHDLDLVQKYIGAKEARPRLDRLGSSSWVGTKRKVKKRIEDLAKELLRIQAEREISEGYAYPEEDELFREMESKFEYEETEGQLRAIRDVLGDLKRKRPMDRLICGDVGFGKTEVAIRAAFKVAIEGKQVAVLVPTTVLAQQHLKVFTERLKDYPLVIEMLSRFVPRERQKEIVERLRKGAIDIVIGTHRLLQRDVSFKDLGLLIVDEEHRFGVKDKERLKEVKKTVDVLTLTATPIPRTLSMALSGIKDLSIIDTPPLDRLAIKTYVVRFSEDVIRRGILAELARGGQIFFVHNYIHNIHVVYEYLRALFPSLRIALAHGRMKERQLESIMVDFVEGKYDLLLSTNIIESGLDISNVNTIFINNAHKFGLADLYQLRGRVGRGPRQAYAYLLVPEGERLTEEAKTRLRIIEELQEIGSGIHIANYDLELRGAGNILGKEQSGNIELVGFELYTKLLEETIKELKAERKEEEPISPEISIPLDAYIPESYVEDTAQKLLLYKRLSKVGSYEEIKEMEEEMRDRFGELPPPTRNLLAILSLKVFLSDLYVKRVEYAPGSLTITVTDRTPLNMEELILLARRDGIKLMPDRRIVMRFDGRPLEAVEAVKNVLKDITPYDITRLTQTRGET
jgi:transcription-repair coupling factor (superfamily II helicase)